VEADVPFEVVPGVSSLAAVPAAAGIPVTHRGVSSQVTIVNGHGPLDYGGLAAAPGTLVVFMGLGRLEELATRLIEHGRPASTAAAVIARGTLPEQRVVIAPLARITEAADDLEPPALVVIGDVVGLAGLLVPAAAATAA
jgi:siroheme synthase